MNEASKHAMILNIRAMISGAKVDFGVRIAPL